MALCFSPVDGAREAEEGEPNKYQRDAADDHRHSLGLLVREHVLVEGQEYLWRRLDAMPPPVPGSAGVPPRACRADFHVAHHSAEIVDRLHDPLSPRRDDERASPYRPLHQRARKLVPAPFGRETLVIAADGVHRGVPRRKVDGHGRPADPQAIEVVAFKVAEVDVGRGDRHVVAAELQGHVPRQVKILRKRDPWHVVHRIQEKLLVQRHLYKGALPLPRGAPAP
eukprot:CAMPEP_0170192016 /NCGR_PEP_ID=MMETSP0040_2-20121228/53121_1 /TAXON_ID=641309 /ORGANISM="Lotharella oceanica, Strain CCMP622" /LENGTH=224 /DNA_ID=CAMNT_0010440255 /DNA_START=314 /DNA_END=989 /DNA_ORIENTATION=-